MTGFYWGSFGKSGLVVSSATEMGLQLSKATSDMG